MKRPNVLLLYTDQQRWDTIRAAGNDLVHTPNLDALAARGVLFDNTFVNCPVCMPSRMSMLSGQYPEALGITQNGFEMPMDVPCLHHILKRYGYHTANLGKIHFLNHASQFRDHKTPYPDYGFDTAIISDEPGCYDDPYIKWVAEHDPDQVANCRVSTPPAWTGQAIDVHPRGTQHPYTFAGPEELTHSAFVADETIDCIRRHKDERFFCIAGFYAPHAPLNPPQRFVDMYDIDKMPLPAYNPEENVGEVVDAQWRKTVAYYYALISHVDDQVGRILDVLRDEGLEDDTLVVFTSDHGEYLGDHGKTGKGGPEDSSSHVPLIVSWPERFQAQGIRDEIVEAVDIAPSILDCCGVQIPPSFQGRSFRPLIEGRDYEPRSSAFIEHGVHSYRAVRTLEHLYALYPNGSERLFDLREDPQQLTNIASDPAHKAALESCRFELLQRWRDVSRRDRRRTAHY